MKCCKLLADGKPEPLPFERVLATGYYDGPTEGFTECRQCKLAYAFRKLDWDDAQDMRIFAFAPLEISFEAIAALISPLAKSNPVVTVSPLGETEQKFVQGLFAYPVTHVAAFEGWPGVSSLWRRIGTVDVSVPRDWFAYFGIKKKTDV
jgi:hypothetical protein